MLQLCLIKAKFTKNLRDSERGKNISQLAPICTERISISIYRNKYCESKHLGKVSMHLKNSQEKFELKVFCVPSTCLPVQKQSSNFAKENLII